MVNNSWAEITPQKAIEYWRSKSIVSVSEFDTLSDIEKLRAFTASNIEQIRELQKIYDVIDESISKGISLKKAKENILSQVPISEMQAETILRTNIFSAYSAGRYSDVQASKKTRPYLRYSAVEDERTRPSHLAIHGKIYPVDDPFWSVNFPPNGYNCRCDVISLSERQVQKSGLKVETTPQGKNPFALSKAFSHHPQELYKPVLDKYNPILRQKYIENVVEYTNSDMVQVAKLLNQEDLELAESIIKTQGYKNIEEYKQFIDDVLEQKQSTGKTVFIGNLPAKVIRFLKKMGIEPALALTVLSDERLLHMTRDFKENKGATLTIEEIKSIPTKLKEKDTLWFYDKNNNAVLMAFLRFGHEYLKVAIKVNRKVGKGKANEIITSGKIKGSNLFDEPDKYYKI